MPKTLSDIPVGQTIVDKIGAITLFFRFRWAELQAAFQQTPTVANSGPSAVQSAALPTTTVFTVQTGGQYLIAYLLKRVTADGAASTLQATYGWTQDGQALTHVGRLMNVDSVTADPTDAPFMVSADANSSITVAVAYTSTTPGNMTWKRAEAVLQLA